MNTKRHRRGVFQKLRLEELEVRINPYQLGSRWSDTVTDGGGLTQGTPTTLRWSFVQDGVNIPGGFGEQASNSNLIAFLDGLYGAGPGGTDFTQRPWFNLFTSIYGRLSEVSGLNYVYEPNDDGAAFSSSPGALNVRGDIRVAGHSIDGASNVLAYAFFPNGGDMVIDTSDGGFFSQAANNFVGMRNVLGHETGHGVGMDHEIPTDGTTLMEPFVNTNFDGPQFDDILGLQRHYGDFFEKPSGNDTLGTATPLGPINPGATLIKGASGNTTTELTGATATDFLSIDGTTDTDVFSFSLPATSILSITLTPVGPTYQSGPQGGTAVTFVAANQSNLKLELLNSAGGVLVSLDANGLGAAEAINNFNVGGGGTFYARISGANDLAQMYMLEINVKPQPFDFGDAPDTYGTTLARNGARHTGIGLTLGTARDQESDAATPRDGTGDDVTGSDDEDGVSFGLLVPGELSTATVNVQGGSGFLNAWVDLDGDGVFGAGEQIATNRPVGVGNNVVTFALPGTAALGTHYARFRLTSDSVASPSPLGLLPDGEVEDYAVRFVVVNVTLIGGNLAFVDPSNRPDALRVTRVGANLRFNDPNNHVTAGLGATQVDLNTVEVAFAAVAGRLQITTGGGDDKVSLNLAGGLLPPGGISYQGGTGNDSLSVQGGSSISVAGPFAFDGGDGSDTFQVVGSAAFASLDFLGGEGDDKLLVESALTVPAGGQLSFEGGPGNDSIAAGSANVGLVHFVGGAGNDSLSVSGGLNASSLTFDGGAGNDSVAVAGALTGNTFLLNVGDGDDSVNLGPATVSTLLNYAGGEGSDRLIFAGTLSVPAGGSLLFDGGDGNDRIDLQNATVNRFLFNGLGGDDILSLKGNLNVTPGGNFTFDAGAGNDRMEIGATVSAAGAVFGYLGGDGTDTIASTGTAPHTWNVNVNTVTFDQRLTFSTIENVQGGVGPDQFVFRPGSRFAGTLDGGGGRDVLNLTTLGTVGVALDTAGAADGFTVSFSGATRGAVRNINRVNAGGGRLDTFVGLNTASGWALDAGGGSYASQGFSMSFGGFEALRGGAGPDNLGVVPGFAPAAFDGGLGFDRVRVNGSVGNDVFGFGPSAVVVNGRALSLSRVESLEVFGGAGNDRFNAAGLAYAFARLDLYGEAGADTFNVTPAQTTNLRVFGGRDAAIDALVIQRGTATFAGARPPLTARAGRYSFAGRLPIDFADIDVVRGTRSQFLPSSF